jgi:branched-chain amino acid transport system substrate-binding protein
MQRYYPEGTVKDPLNVYAYLAGQTLVQVLEQAGEDLSRENVMRQAASLHDLELGMLLPSIRINTAADDFFPIEALQLMRFDGVSWKPIGAVIDVGR